MTEHWARIATGCLCKAPSSFRVRIACLLKGIRILDNCTVLAWMWSALLPPLGTWCFDSVCLSDNFNSWTNFEEIFKEGQKRHKHQLIRFWEGSRSLSVKELLIEFLYLCEIVPFSNTVNTQRAQNRMLDFQCFSPENRLGLWKPSRRRMFLVQIWRTQHNWLLWHTFSNMHLYAKHN